MHHVYGAVKHDETEILSEINYFVTNDYSLQFNEQKTYAKIFAGNLNEELGKIVMPGGRPFDLAVNKKKSDELIFVACTIEDTT